MNYRSNMHCQDGDGEQSLKQNSYKRLNLDQQYGIKWDRIVHSSSLEVIFNKVNLRKNDFSYLVQMVAFLSIWSQILVDDGVHDLNKMFCVVHMVLLCKDHPITGNANIEVQWINDWHKYNPLYETEHNRKIPGEKYMSFALTKAHIKWCAKEFLKYSKSELTYPECFSVLCCRHSPLSKNDASQR